VLLRTQIEHEIIGIKSIKINGILRDQGWGGCAFMFGINLINEKFAIFSQIFDSSWPEIRKN
jgi:hypothetical protein